MAKRPNPNLAKIHRNYTVEEVANLLSVHKNTVRLWVKDGLATNDDKRPLLILGADLRQYLQSKRAVKKRQCSPLEIYCVRCRVPQLPAENMVDYEPINCNSGRLIGLCPSCNGIINKFVNFAKLQQIQDQLDITFPKALQHINESNKPLLNSDFN
ncbi:MAG: helix-turn-helix domain-containing protein [Methylovulum miyakonense]|uniref:helix-turn-helix domain-containing protein n=1 Tax=Methylovulum miyakonense TaxID=645578 RepID=UPI003BB5ABBA